MQLLHQLGTVAMGWINHLGYLGIFVGMVLESACIPIPSEVIMPFSGYLVATGHLSFIVAVLMGTLGNLLGSVLAYYVGKWGGKPFVNRFGKYVLFSHKHFEASEKFFTKRGELTVFLSRILPAIRTFISLPAGIFNMNLPKFLMYTVIGSFVWSLLLTYVGLVLGQNWGNIENYLHPIAYVVVAIVGFSVVGFILKKRNKIIQEEKDNSTKKVG